MSEKSRKSPPTAVTQSTLTLWQRLVRMVVGGPRRLADRSIFHSLALMPFLAWVGLGGDGLSSSAYGPEEAFRALGEHRYLALPLAVAVAGTVILISACYMRVIERFPSGGGGYVVSTKLLGPRVGVVAASALVVDYVLTIAVSIAAGADALFSLFPEHFAVYKVPAAICLVGLLAVLNIRGVKESVTALVPIFLVFVFTHLAMIVFGIVGNLEHAQEVLAKANTMATHDRETIGLVAVLALLARAYSMGAGTFTGIEAVSAGLPVLRAPRVENGKRTMIYMAASLAFTASGILCCYLLTGVEPQAGKTLNASLAERVFFALPGGETIGPALVALTLAAEGSLLLVAAQTGFIGGPRIMSFMAVDSWLPHRFGALSERLTTTNGVFLMAISAVFFIVVTGGSTHALVIMYSINVFLDFTLCMTGMCRAAWSERRDPASKWGRQLILQGAGLVLCATILAVMIYEKFMLGGWMTVAITGGLVILCHIVRRHYRGVGAMMHSLDKDLADIAVTGMPTDAKIDEKKPIAVVLVGGFSGFGVHTMLNVLKTFPGHFRQFAFVSVAVVDTGSFKGADQLEALKRQTEGALQRYLDLAHRLGFPATYEMAVGTEVVSGAEKCCKGLVERFPNAVFFGGKLVFREDRWFQRLLHNESAYAVQRRLQWSGLPMLVLPIRLEDK